MLDTIKENLATINEEMARMIKHVGIETPMPTVVAVSKVQPDERVDAALAAGLRVFGENRVQEAQGRWADRKQSYPDLELRLIGSLQTNKAKDAVALFDVIESVDRIKLANALKREMDAQGKDLPVYIQVNVGAEEQKGGVMAADLPDLVNHCRDIGLNLVGLMCIPPAGDDPAPYFALLKKFAKDHGLNKLSMGMSGDYALAASMGATSVRVGTAIFGARDY